MLHENYIKNISVKLTQKEYDLLQKYCNKYGLNMSKLIRKLLYNQVIIKEGLLNENK